MSDLPPCDKDVWNNGTTVFYGHSLRSDKFESWVRHVQKLSGPGQKVDWSYVGGRIVVRALGDLDKVHDALFKSRDLFRELFIEANDEDSMSIEIGKGLYKEIPGKLTYMNKDPKMWPSDKVVD